MASFDVEPLDATFGAVVTGLRLAELDDAAFAALYRTWLDHALLIFPGQHLARSDPCPVHARHRHGRTPHRRRRPG